jgi:origin recognition complex subunit 4
MAKEFARYRMTLDREDVKRVAERTGQVMLKKWLNKAE